MLVSGFVVVGGRSVLQLRSHEKGNQSLSRFIQQANDHARPELLLADYVHLQGEAHALSDELKEVLAQFLDEYRVSS